MTQEFDPSDLAIANRNGALVDLQPGDRIFDGEGDEATFLGYGDRAPIYVNLKYPNIGMQLRIPNSELRRAA